MKDIEPARVLIVDDSPATRRLLEIQLEEAGFQVMTAVNGGRCLELARAEGPEVILMDIRMPGMDGIETCRRLKENHETEHIPVLFITTFGEDEPTALEALEAGGNDFVSKDCSHHILAARVNSQVAIYRAHQKLKQMAMTDELTGVGSRHRLLEVLRGTVIGTSRRGSNAISFLLIDVDHFKAVNDNFGHAAGDAVLRAVAQTIKAACRETDLVGRFGGDEFVAILPATDEAGAAKVAEKIRAAVETTCEHATVSIGLASMAAPEAEALKGEGTVETCIAQLMKLADGALYVAKARGRNQVTASDEARICP